jgi:hypothetical protein
MVTLRRSENHSCNQHGQLDCDRNSSVAAYRDPHVVGSENSVASRPSTRGETWR